MESLQHLVRKDSPVLNEKLGWAIKLLDDGFVRAIDYQGNDESIVRAARISYGAGTKTPSDDRSLIRYLMRHRHTTPFEMAEITFHIRIPMDAWRQMVRHRTASINEYSTRYSEAIDSAQTTEPHMWRSQSKDNKQGSGDYLPPDVGAGLSAREKELHELAFAIYQERLKAGVAREQARKDLPLSTYTEVYWKCDLHNIFHFLALRLDPHAQWEIRQYAQAMADIVKAWVPLAWEAFEDYRLHAMTLSSAVKQIVAAVVEDDQERAIEIARVEGWLVTNENGGLKESRERKEADATLNALGIVPPWYPKPVKYA